jgi:hypothetical protein
MGWNLGWGGGGLVVCPQDRWLISLLFPAMGFLPNKDQPDSTPWMGKMIHPTLENFLPFSKD